MAIEDPGPIPEENENIEDSIEDIIETIMAMPQFATGDPTAGGTSRANALARELQLFLESVESYQNGELSWQQMSSVTPSNLLEDEEFAGYYDELMSVFEAEEVVNVLTTDPARLSEFEELQFSQTEQIITNSAFSFVGATPPVTTAGSNRSVVITGGAGVTGEFERIKNTGGRVFGETVPVVQYDPDTGEPLRDENGDVITKDEYREGLLDVMVPYIPGIEIPDWMPSAGVIFLPTIQEAVNKVGTIVENSGIGEAWEEGDIGEVLNDIGEIIVRSGEAAAGKVKDIIGGILGGIGNPATAGTVLGGVIGTTFPSIPDWLPPLITDPRVYGAVRNVLTQNFNTPENQFPPLTEEVETEQDPNILFTNRGDNYFVSSEGDEYFQLAESEDVDFELNGQYTREQLEDTGLETINSGTYQSLLDDLSFHALEEDIYQYSMEELIERYETEGGILPGDWKLMDEESQYNFFLDDYFDIPRLIEDPDKDDDDVVNQDDDVVNQDDDAVNQDDDAVNQDVDDDSDDDSIVADLFEDVVGESEQRILQGIIDAGYATPDDITTALEEANLLTAENLRTTLEASGFATPQDIADAFDAAGLATPQDVTDAIAAAGLATPQDVIDALDSFGFTDAQLQQIAGALPESLTTDQLNAALSDALAGIATGTDLDTATTTITDAISGLGFATAEDVRTALSEFGFTDAQLEQIVGALPENLSLTDLNNALNTALEGFALGTDLDTATDTIIDAVSGLDFATSQDVRDALEAFGFTDEQLEQIAGVIPEGLTLAELNNALTDSLSGIALGTDLDEATTTITDAIGGLAFATTEDIENALLGFNFTQDQLDQISELIPDTLRAGEVEDLLETALTGVSTQEDVDTAFTNLTTNLAEGVSGLEAGQEDILTGQTRIGEEVQSVEDLIMSSTGLLTALGAAGLGGGGASRPAARPFKQFKETFDYAPQEVKPVETKSMDYNKEVDRLLTMGMGGKKPGMLV